MSKYPYTPPQFLNKQSVDEIHQRMLDNLPADIDKSELQLPWDFTRPTAIEKAEFVEYRLNEVIKIMFPQWAYDEYLDLHAEIVGLKRRAGNKATGELLIKGVKGTVIPNGFLFSTPALNGAGILFESAQEYVIDETGELHINVRAVESGINVKEDTVILMVKPITGIKSVTNPKPLTGGSHPEDDDTLRERVLEALRKGISFVGNNADYLRWANDVPGVGRVLVLGEYYGPGTVLLIIVDMNGVPANPQILNAVYNYIVSPQDPLKRLAPIGATVYVEAPTPVPISISAEVILNADADIEKVAADFKSRLEAYYATASQEHSVKYIHVGAILAQTAGISDYENLLINGDTLNISLEDKEYPHNKEVVLYVET